MTDILTKNIALVLNRYWQAINIRTPREAFCRMATNVVTALDVELGENDRAKSLRPVTWDEWITLPIRPQDNSVRATQRVIRVPTAIVAVNFATRRSGVQSSAPAASASVTATAAGICAPSQRPRRHRVETVHRRISIGKANAVRRSPFRDANDNLKTNSK